MNSYCSRQGKLKAFFEYGNGRHFVNGEEFSDSEL
jgi:hypothetical protein